MPELDTVFNRLDEIVQRNAGGIRDRLALSVNSPFWVGHRTGLHSQRIKIMEQLPAAGTPPVLRIYSEYCWVVNQSIQSGFINSIQEIWWDVRKSSSACRSSTISS